MEDYSQYIAIAAKELNIGYHRKKKDLVVAKNIDFSLEKGKMACLLGRNGIGKSTLLRTLLKLQPALSGAIFIDGQNSIDFSANQLAKKISVVLTDQLPQSNLNVDELIALGRQPYTNWLGSMSTADRSHIENAIESTNISHLLSKRIFELSDGERQKVMITRALAQNTTIILLDEPTAHLDIGNRIEIFKILKKLASKQGKTVVISTHEIHLALALADELWLMDTGRFISGETEKLIADNRIAEVFNTEAAVFDKENRRFKITGD